MNPPAAHLNLHRTEAGTLAFTDAMGEVHDNVVPVRLFPLTDPTHWVSINGVGGHELACVREIDELPEITRTLVLDALAERDFVPVIQTIHAIRRAAHGYEWFVTTDHGKTHFCVENDESIQPLGGDSIVVMDHRNARYVIPDPGLMDPKSRHRLERYY